MVHFGCFQLQRAIPRFLITKERRELDFNEARRVDYLKMRQMFCTKSWKMHNVLGMPVVVSNTKKILENPRSVVARAMAALARRRLLCCACICSVLLGKAIPDVTMSLGTSWCPKFSFKNYRSPRNDDENTYQTESTTINQSMKFGVI